MNQNEKIDSVVDAIQTFIIEITRDPGYQNWIFASKKNLQQALKDLFEKEAETNKPTK